MGGRPAFQRGARSDRRGISIQSVTGSTPRGIKNEEFRLGLLISPRVARPISSTQASSSSTAANTGIPRSSKKGRCSSLESATRAPRSRARIVRHSCRCCSGSSARCRRVVRCTTRAAGRLGQPGCRHRPLPHRCRRPLLVLLAPSGLWPLTRGRLQRPPASRRSVTAAASSGLPSSANPGQPCITVGVLSAATASQ